VARRSFNARDNRRPQFNLLSGASAPFLVSCLALWKAGVFEKILVLDDQIRGHYGSQVSIAEGFGFLPDIFGAH